MGINSGFKGLIIQQFYVLPTQCIYVFCVDLRTNGDYFPIQHWLTGLYNRDGVCLLCGTDCVFKYKSVWSWSLLSFPTCQESLWELHRLFTSPLCIRKTLCDLPPVRIQAFLVFLCPQANAQIVPNIPSYHCKLLTQPSRFKFTKINPLALTL